MTAPFVVSSACSGLIDDHRPAAPQTLTISRVRSHPPAPNSIVLGSITRLSPLQALLSISVVDGIPLPPGEEFTGVIRTQDVRATEKDKVKIGECFRGGDVVRGLVVGAAFLK
jgi:exosome complex component CSL4